VLEGAHSGAPSPEVELTYIDGFVLAVPTANKQKFIDHANTGDSVFIDFGATRVVECSADDVPNGKQTEFFRAVDAKNDETLVFSCVEWPDKATRDACIEIMMSDPAHGSSEESRAVRRQADDLWWLRADRGSGRKVTAARWRRSVISA